MSPAGAGAGPTTAATRLPRVSVVIVSYQVRDLLRRCLATVAGQRGVDVETWVVDNASDDGSADMVAAEFPGVHLIRSRENLGFARGNNLALSRTSGEVLALVNPDTELPADTLAATVAVFARHPRAGAMGLALSNTDGTPQPSCLAFPGVWNLALESLALHHLALRFGIGSPAQAPAPRGGEGEVDWVSGAFMAITRTAYERVGGLDESLFMYGEEMDWSWRARALGFTTVHSDAVRVLHHGGASGEGQHGALFVRNLGSRLSFLRRYRGAWRAALAREIMTAGSALRWAMWSARAVAEHLAGGERPYTRLQRERFGAVLAWRRGGA
jgi:GT2 family glycosyltransferase